MQDSLKFWTNKWKSSLNFFFPTANSKLTTETQGVKHRALVAPIPLDAVWESNNLLSKQLEVIKN